MDLKDFDNNADKKPEDTKTLGYDWEFGHEELMLEVATYKHDNRLYVGLYHKDEDGYDESFCDLTINLPNMPVKKGEAYIDDFASKSKLEFIKKHKLGKVLPDMGFSGMSSYHKVAFDLKRLEEFDKQGVERYHSLNGIENKKRKNRTEKAR